MSCNHSQAQLYLNIVSYEFRHNHSKTHIHKHLPPIMTCSRSSDRVTHRPCSSKTRSNPQQMEGERPPVKRKVTLYLRTKQTRRSA